MAGVVSYCPRCGARGLDDPSMCASCFDGSADRDRAEAIVAAAVRGVREAQRMLRDIDDPRAFDVLVAAADIDGQGARVLEALGSIGNQGAAAVAAARLADRDRSVREAAIGCLTELGPANADAIATRLDDPVDREAAAIALAWLQDLRGLDPLIDLVSGSSLAQLATSFANVYRSSIAALVWLDDARARSAVEALVDRLGGVATGDEPPWVRGGVALRIWSALDRCTDAWADRIRSRLTEAIGEGAFPGPAAATRRATDNLARTVPRWSMTLRRLDRPIDEPVTKIGGQPVWRSGPAWPIALDGAPMPFYAQFALPWADRTAYLFIDPEASGALICQPGRIDVPVEARETGPSVAMETDAQDSFVIRRRDVCSEAAVDLEPGNDPQAWDEPAFAGPEATDDRDWNKIGGTPIWLQEDVTPDEPGWRFLFQFTAAAMGRELGDGAEVYGLVHDDGRGLVSIQSH